VSAVRPASAWSGARPERLARWLLLAGAAALPLQNTATLDIGFTVRPSHLLLGLALVVGLPFAWRGFLLLPAWLRWPAVGLVGIYALATVMGDLATIAGTPRGGSARAAVYLADLAQGAAVMCLVPGLYRGRLALRPLLLALAAGTGLAALYALWQWPAQRFGLPLTDILTTADSNAITRGGEQGAGLLGWERARGTFLEPHFLGAFMSAAVPLAVVASLQAQGARRMLAAVAAAAGLGALVVSSSAPAYAGFAIATAVAGAAWGVGTGRPRLAALAAAATTSALLAAPVVVAAPEVLAAVTGRDAATLTITAEFRTRTWSRVLDIWAVQPAYGHGAGQSSVQLSLLSEGSSAVGLQSAQGLWASSLIDTGAVGLGIWVVLLGAFISVALREVWRRPSAVNALLLLAAVAAVCSALVAGDRLDLRTWLLVGVVAGASGSALRAPGARSPGTARRERPDRSAGEAH
jgi:hypothetical protein